MGDLIRAASAALRQHAKALCVGILVFGLLLFAIQLGSRLGLNVIRDRTLAELTIRAPSPGSLGGWSQQVTRAIGGMVLKPQPGFTSAQSARYALFAVPVKLLAALCSAFLWICSLLYAQLILQCSLRAKQALQALRYWLPRMLSVLGRGFGLSYLWIPALCVLGTRFLPGISDILLFFAMAGLVLFLHQGPRYVLAPVLLVETDMPPAEAIRESVRRSEGWWWPILLWLLIPGLMLEAAAMIVSMLWDQEIRILQPVVGSAVNVLAHQAAATLFIAVALMAMETIIWESSPDSAVPGDGDDGGEVLGLERASTDESAVDVGERQDA